MPDDALLPSGWRETTLGALGEYLNGRAFKRSEWSKTGRPIIRIQDLTGSRESPNFFDGYTEDRYVVRRGDLLISWSATLGAYIWDGPEAVLNQHIFKVNSRINKRFHYHLVRGCLADLAAKAHGSGMVHVTKGVFDATPVVIPTDLTMQQHLADLLDRVDKARDGVMAHVSAGSLLVAKLRQAILVAACSGRLTEDWRQQRRQPGHRPKLPCTPRPIAAAIDTPEDWSWFRLGDVAELQGGIQVGVTRRPDRPLRAVPYLRVANVQKGWLDLSEVKTIMAPEETIRLLRLQPGDMLFNEGGDRDKLGRGWIWEGQIVECIHQNHVFRGRLYDSRMQPRLYSWYGNTAGMTYFFAEGKQTVNLASLSKTKLSQLPVPIPSIEEQAEIVRRVERLLYLVDELQGRVEAVARKVDRSSQAVLAKCVRGDLAGVTV